MSSWSNVQVYWLPVKSCSCDWSVANKEEKQGLLSLPAAEHKTFTQPNTDADTQLLVLCCSYFVCYVQTILINQSFFFKGKCVFSSTMKILFITSI